MDISKIQCLVEHHQRMNWQSYVLPTADLAELVRVYKLAQKVRGNCILLWHDNNRKELLAEIERLPK